LHGGFKKQTLLLRKQHFEVVKIFKYYHPFRSSFELDFAKKCYQTSILVRFYSLFCIFGQTIIHKEEI